MPIHPFLFAIYPPLFIYTRNMHVIPFYLPGLTVAALLAVTGAAYFLFKWIFRDSLKAALLVSLALAVCCLYPAFFQSAVGLRLMGFLIWRHKYVFPAWLLFFGVACSLAVRTKKNVSPLTGLLNVMGCILLFFCALQAGSHLMKGHPAAPPPIQPAPMEKISEPLSNAVSTNYRPDIYYILLDTYGGFDSLKHFFHFDNSEFYEALEFRGFYVARESASNYPKTRLSLASTLNMDYLDCTSGDCGENPEAAYSTHLSKAIKNNRVARLLRSLGYRFVQIGWQNEYADESHEYRQRQLFDQYVFLKSMIDFTFLKYFTGAYSFGTQSGQRSSVLFAFEAAALQAEKKGPQFVYAHIFCPHEPYVFNEDGGTVTLREALKYGERGNYVRQVRFTNKKALEIVDRILEKSPDAVIILQGDHGPPIGAPTDNIHDPNAAAHALLILNAYHFPLEKARKALYSTVSPVNSFRILMNAYFDQKYPLLNDRSFDMNGDQSVDVTESIERFRLRRQEAAVKA